MKKRRILLITTFLLLVFGLAGGMSKPAAVPAQAKTYSSKVKAKKEISKLTKQINKVEKDLAKAKKEYKKYKSQSDKTKKGTIPIMLAKVVNNSPLAVQYLGKYYYYVINPGKSSVIFGLYTGEVRKTGATKTINGITYTGVKEIRDPAYDKAQKVRKKYTRCQAKYNKLWEKRADLKKGLTFRVKGGKYTVYLNAKESLNPDGNYYNRIKWKSSNPSVATVSQKGVVTGKKIGKVTITARTSLSKKTSRVTVSVKKRPKLKLSLTNVILPVGKEQIIKVNETIKSGTTVEWSTSNKKIVECTTGDPQKRKTVYLKPKSEGTATITARYEEKIAYVQVQVYQGTARFLEERLEYTQKDIGEQRTYKFNCNLPDIEVTNSDDFRLRVDSVNYSNPQAAEGKMAEGSVTVTFLNNSDYEDNIVEDISLNFDLPADELGIKLNKNKLVLHYQQADDDSGEYGSGGEDVADSPSLVLQDWETGQEFTSLECRAMEGAYVPYATYYTLNGARIDSIEYDSDYLKCELDEVVEDNFKLWALAPGETALKIRMRDEGIVYNVPVSIKPIILYEEEGNEVKYDETVRLPYEEGRNYRFQLINGNVQGVILINNEQVCWPETVQVRPCEGGFELSAASPESLYVVVGIEPEITYCFYIEFEQESEYPAIPTPPAVVTMPPAETPTPTAVPTVPVGTPTPTAVLPIPSAAPTVTPTPALPVESENPDGSDRQDVDILKELIRTQRECGATVNEDVNSYEYIWEGNKLKEIHWQGKNLSGNLDMSKFLNLTYLDCGYNELTGLDVSKNVDLVYLDGAGNQLTSLDVSQNTKLDFLHCHDNKLTVLDVSNNKELTDLSCFINQLTSLDVSKNTKLTNLECDINPLGSLDISKNVKLTNVDCHANGLFSLDVSNNVELVFLECGENQLSSLDLTNNTKLKDLICDDTVNVTGFNKVDS